MKRGLSTKRGEVPTQRVPSCSSPAATGKSDTRRPCASSRHPPSCPPPPPGPPPPRSPPPPKTGLKEPAGSGKRYMTSRGVLGGWRTQKTGRDDWGQSQAQPGRHVRAAAQRRSVRPKAAGGLGPDPGQRVASHAQPDPPARPPAHLVGAAAAHAAPHFLHPRFALPPPRLRRVPQLVSGDAQQAAAAPFALAVPLLLLLPPICHLHRSPAGAGGLQLRGGDAQQVAPAPSAKPVAGLRLAAPCCALEEGGGKEGKCVFHTGGRGSTGGRRGPAQTEAHWQYLAPCQPVATTACESRGCLPSISLDPCLPPSPAAGGAAATSPRAAAAPSALQARQAPAAAAPPAPAAAPAQRRQSAAAAPRLPAPPQQRRRRFRCLPHCPRPIPVHSGRQSLQTGHRTRPHPERTAFPPTPVAAAAAGSAAHVSCSGSLRGRLQQPALPAQQTATPPAAPPPAPPAAAPSPVPRAATGVEQALVSGVSAGNNGFTPGALGGEGGGDTLHGFALRPASPCPSKA